MIYARAHDQTVADDYFAAMQRVEWRLEIVPADKKNNDAVVKVQERFRADQLIEQLEVPQLCLEDRLELTSRLREIFVIKSSI